MCRGRSISFSMYTFGLPKACSASVARGLKRRDQFLLRAHHAHAAPAAALGGLDHQRKADFGRDSLGRVFVRHHSGAARNDRQARGGHFRARAVLFAHHANHFRRRPDKGDVRGLADFGEIGILGKKSVAGMDGVHIGNFRGADHLRNVQVALAAARRPDANGLIGKAHVQAHCGPPRNRRRRFERPVPCRRSECAARFRRDWRSEFFETCVWDSIRMLQESQDLAGPNGTVRKPISCRARECRKAARRIRPAGRSPTKICTTSPATSDSISFISFMASMMQSTWPGSTFAPTVTNGPHSGLGERIKRPHNRRLDHVNVGCRRPRLPRLATGRGASAGACLAASRRIRQAGCRGGARPRRCAAASSAGYELRRARIRIPRGRASP